MIPCRHWQWTRSMYVLTCLLIQTYLDYLQELNMTMPYMVHNILHIEWNKTKKKITFKHLIIPHNSRSIASRFYHSSNEQPFWFVKKNNGGSSSIEHQLISFFFFFFSLTTWHLRVDQSSSIFSPIIQKHFFPFILSRIQQNDLAEYAGAYIQLRNNKKQGH